MTKMPFYISIDGISDESLPSHFPILFSACDRPNRLCMQSYIQFSSHLGIAQ